MTTDCPEAVRDLSAETITYVKKALGITLEFNSETLPVLYHYIKSVPHATAEMVELISATAGAYFGETVRKQLGGSWDLSPADPRAWQFRLICGLSFCPAGVIAEAIVSGPEAPIDSAFDAPTQLRPHLESILATMTAVSESTYYSLCGRYDTLEHLHDSLLATAANIREQSESN